VRSLSSFDAVYLHVAPVDMRKSLDGLTAMVRHELGLALDGRFLFAFTGKRRDRIKCLYWDKTGMALWYKRLEKDKFRWPRSCESPLRLSAEETRWLLNGLDITKMRPHSPLQVPEIW